MGKEVTFSKSIERDIQRIVWELEDIEDQHESRDRGGFASLSFEFNVKLREKITKAIKFLKEWQDMDRTYTVVEQVYATRYDCCLAC